MTASTKNHIVAGLSTEIAGPSPLALIQSDSSPPYIDLIRDMEDSRIGENIVGPENSTDDIVIVSGGLGRQTVLHFVRTEWIS